MEELLILEMLLLMTLLQFETNKTKKHPLKHGGLTWFHLLLLCWQVKTYLTVIYN